MKTQIPSEIAAKFQAKYACIKNIGEPNPDGIYQTPDGGWQCNYGNGWAITIRPGGGKPHEVHGAICARWYQEGWAFDDTRKPGWLGYPISDEEVYEGDGDSADRISHFENGDIVWTAKTDSTRILNIKDRGKWYETRRNELLSLLGEATALDLPEKYAEELRETARKCQEDAFEIALVGEFQGGKSTTFNALCDGRDISPRGLGGGGIKTSAVVISAQNIAGEETKDGLAEWAEVRFRTKEAIALGMATILRPRLMDSEELRALNPEMSDQEYENAIATDDGFPEVVDLEDVRCRELLLGTTDELWEKWESDKANALDDDELDQLRIATLQLRFFGSDEYNRLRGLDMLPIDRFQKLVAFPKDWQPRWRDGNRAQFDFDETAFVFLQSVLVRIHSANLKRLGCRITDCPGLFANAFDTSVAEQVIRRADAVWYLINGESELGAKDRKAIRKIAAWGLDGKIQATANIHSDWETKSGEVLDATKSTLSNMGLVFEVIPYNARLAFLAAQGKLLLEQPGLFSELDKANMKTDAKAKDENPAPAGMWAKMVRRVGLSMAVGELEDISDLDPASVGMVRDASRFGEILERLESDIIPMKAGSILVNRGSERAAKALKACEGLLRTAENAAEAEEAKWSTALEDARRQLDDFVQRAKKIIQRSVLDSELVPRARSLAEGILTIALDRQYIDTLTHHFAEKVVDCPWSWKQEKMLADIKREVVPVFVQDSRDAVSRALEQWKKGEEVGKLRQALKFVCEDIHELWEEKEINALEVLEGFEAPSIPEEDIGELCDAFSQTLFQNQQMVGALKEMKSIWRVMSQKILDVGEELAILLFSLLDGYFNNAETLVDYDALRTVRRTERIGPIVARSRDKIANAVNDKHFQDGIREPLEEQLRAALEAIGQKLKRRLDDLKSDFEKERVETSERMFWKSAAERKSIAERNKALRTATIMPLRRRIESFQVAISAELKA